MAPTRRGPLLATAVCLPLIAATALCTYLLTPPNPPPPTPPRHGARLDSNGAIAQQILGQPSYTESLPFPGPEGFTRQRHYTYAYTLHDGPRQLDLPFLRTSPLPMPDCHPVANTDLWAAAGYLPHPGGPLVVLVFDRKGFRYNHTLPVVTDWNHPGNDFRFTDDNHTLLFRSATGFDAYDVLTDRVTPSAPAHR